jgi:integrase
MRLRDVWDEQDLAFPNGIGRPQSAQNLLPRSFYPLVEKADVPRIHFHDLRYTVARLIKKAGVSTSGIAETFGHESESTTDDFYGHDVPELKQQAIDTLEQVLKKPSEEDESQSKPQSN